MPQERMKFCASLNRCSQAYTVGKPGTVRIAKDRAPLDEDKLNKLLGFLADRLSPEDFATMQDLIDDVVDDAEATNPSEEMAQDGLSQSTRRSIRRVRRDVLLGFDARPPGRPGAHPRVARDSMGFAARYPDAARIGSDTSQPWELQYPPQTARSSPPRVAMDAASTKSFEDRFPSATRIGKAS